MGNTVKYYHRGNNDAAEANTLTAVFIVTLMVDNAACTTTKAASLFIPDFGGGNEYLVAMPEEIKMAKGKKKGTSKVKAEMACVGDVVVRVNVEISSPTGRGNGEAQAGPIAAQFGLEHNGRFSRFNGGALAPGSEHWRVVRTIQIGTTPCAGGRLQGVIKINDGARRPASYNINYDVDIASCGTINRETFRVVAGNPPRGLGAGGRVRNIFREVRPTNPGPPRTPGDRPPYLPKNPPAGGNLEVGPDGQVRQRP